MTATASEKDFIKRLVVTKMVTSRGILDKPNAPTIKPASTPSSRSCKGVADPRMAEAVQIRLSFPELPLIDVLELAGFSFISKNESGSLVDTENTTIEQRRNNLCRRVRQEKRRLAEKEAAAGKAEAKKPPKDQQVGGVNNSSNGQNKSGGCVGGVPIDIALATLARKRRLSLEVYGKKELGLQPKKNATRDESQTKNASQDERLAALNLVSLATSSSSDTTTNLSGETSTAIPSLGNPNAPPQAAAPEESTPKAEMGQQASTTRTTPRNPSREASTLAGTTTQPSAPILILPKISHTATVAVAEATPKRPTDNHAAAVDVSYVAPSSLFHRPTHMKLMRDSMASLMASRTGMPLLTSSNITTRNAIPEASAESTPKPSMGKPASTTTTTTNQETTTTNASADIPILPNITRHTVMSKVAAVTEATPKRPTVKHTSYNHLKLMRDSMASLMASRNNSIPSETIATVSCNTLLEASATQKPAAKHAMEMSSHVNPSSLPRRRPEHIKLMRESLASLMASTRKAPTPATITNLAAAAVGATPRPPADSQAMETTDHALSTLPQCPAVKQDSNGKEQRKCTREDRNGHKHLESGPLAKRIRRRAAEEC